MKKFLLSFIIPILTFAVGIFVYRIIIPKTNLSEISNNTSFYDGKTIEIETYLMSQRLGEFLWTITDFDKNPSAVTVAYFEDDSIKPDFIKTETSKDKFKMAKVLIKGKVLYNCRSGCCMKSFTIEPQKIRLLSPVEDYTETE